MSDDQLQAAGLDERTTSPLFSDRNLSPGTRQLSDYSIADFVRADEPDQEPGIQAAPTRRSSIKARAAGARQIIRYDQETAR